MVKYTEEQLLAAKDEGHVSQPEILEAFNAMVEEVKEHAALEAEKHKLKWNNGDTYIDENGNERPYHHLNKRRPSRTTPNPNFRKKSVDVIQDDDGWNTLKTKKSSFSEDNGIEERNKFRSNVRDGFKTKPNNKNLGSSKAVDPRDTNDKQAKPFNAFAALNDDSDEDDNSENEWTKV